MPDDSKAWRPLEGTADRILERSPRPLEALARGEVPALVLRGVYPSDHCRALLERFAERGLLYDPHATSEGKPHRVDIGTSFDTAAGPGVESVAPHSTNGPSACRRFSTRA